MENLMPLTNFTSADLMNVDAQTGKPDGTMKLMYLVGNPRQYRFDAGKGIFNLNGEIPITKKLEPFSFTPIAFRLFRDSLFQKTGTEEKIKDWVEFFFVNESHQICVVSFHEYSVQSFMQHYADYLFYDSLTPCECVFTVTPIAKEKEIINPETGKKEKANYTIASFRSVKAKKETIEAIRLISEMIRPIYRKDTFKELVKHTESQNFKLLETSNSENMRLLNEEKEQEERLKAFDEIGISRVGKVKKAA